MKVCSSCHKHVVAGFVEFPCPGNMKVKVIRCLQCRESGKTYTVTTDTGVFVGP